MTRLAPGDADGEPPDLPPQRWSVAIFSARESAAVLNGTLQAAVHADRCGAALTVDLLINGNDRLAAEMRGHLAAVTAWPHATTIRLWSAAHADKAHVWNDYLHGPIPAGTLAFFMDGYVTVERDALALVADALARRPTALAATCVPSAGRSAPLVRRRVVAEGGLHGNLYALTADTVRRLRESGFCLPRGIYRNDSALGAALAFDLDPARNAWSHDRIVAVTEARYRTPVGDPTRPGDLLALVRRRLRQARGHLETRALQAHLAEARRSPSAWPDTARALVLQWASEHRHEAKALLWRHPMAWSALHGLRRAADERRCTGRIECLGEFAPAATRRAEAPLSAR
jgi:hypothetical protein